MQETLKLIQRVTSSILENKNGSFKAKAKPHITRLAYQQQQPVSSSTMKKKQLVIPRSAIKPAENNTMLSRIEEEPSNIDEDGGGDTIVSNLDKILLNLSE